MIEPKDISYSSFKEEKDYIFDYKDVDISQISSSDIQGFSIHNISREVAVAKILEYIENKNSGGVLEILVENPLPAATTGFINGIKITGSDNTRKIYFEN